MGFEKEATSSSYTLKMPPAREDSPLLGKGKPKSGQFKTFANIFMAIVGSGVLGLPYAFRRTGWLMGAIMLFSVAALIDYCMMLLVQTRRRLDTLNGGLSKIASFGDVGYAVCGPVGRFVVDFLIVFSQAGFCVGYLIFIGTTLANLFDPDSPPSLRRRVSTLGYEFMGLSTKSLFIWACFPFQLGLNSIKTLTHLVPLSIFSDVVELGSMAVVMFEDVKEWFKHRPDVVAFGGMSVFFYGLGVFVYAYEVVGMVLPLESETKNKDKFGKVLALGMGLITTIYVAFGILGYLAFGQDTMDIITANLGPGLVTTAVKLGLSVNLFFTFPMMTNPAFEVLERRFCGGKYNLWLRWLLVLVVTLVGIYVPNYADFLSLVGSSMCFAIGFVLPSLFHLLVFKEEMGWRQWIVDMVILTMGVVFAIAGTWSSISEMFAVKG